MLHKIKELCKKNGITVAYLEKQIGLAPKGIYKWDIQEPSVMKVYKASKVLGVTMEEIVEG